MAELILKHIRKTYGSGKTAVKDFSLNIADGEFVIIVGPSGCGKSTTLRMIAGLAEADGGEIFMDGQSLRGVSPANEKTVQRRNCGESEGGGCPFGN